MRKILFVCTGNTCRSPMAQAILLKLLKERLEEEEFKKYSVLSAGIFAIDGLPASDKAKEVMLLNNIDLSKHTSRQVSHDLIANADVILTMTRAHRDQLADMFPTHVQRILTIGEFIGKFEDITDPFGWGKEAYMATYKQLSEAMEEVLNKLLPNSSIDPGGYKKVAIGCDHAGLKLKEYVTDKLEQRGYNLIDCGTYTEESCDYPDIAEKVAEEALRLDIPGVIICGTGIGVAIAANKIPGIRAAVCHDVFTARMAREHNNANVITLGARIVEKEAAVDIVKTFLETGFEAGRHIRRVEKINIIENRSQERSKNGRDYIEKYLRAVDPDVAEAISKEETRQSRKLELIASENFVSRAVMAAQGSVMTNKYAEGYPGKRYYGGCEYVDIVEEIARERAKELFGSDHANVQPHSGAQANTAVYYAAVNPGDTILGMSLNHGGHLTHGSKVNISGKYFNFVEYGVSPLTETIDYDELKAIALKSKPRMIVAGASAYPRIIDFKKMKEIADEVGAYLFVDMAHIAGLVAVGLHPSPIPYADFVTTTTHKTLRGPRGGIILCKKEWAASIDKAVFPGIQGGPLMHVIAAKAVCLKEAMTENFREYQKDILRNAAALSSTLVKKGLRLVSGGTDNHLMLVDVQPKNLTGKEAEAILESVNITVNKNAIPFDPQKPTVTSGIRIGTPAVTSRGMKVNEMVEIGNAIALALDHPGNRTVINQVKAVVARLCEKFPLYKE